MSTEVQELFDFIATGTKKNLVANAFEGSAGTLSYQVFLDYVVAISKAMKAANVQFGDYIFLNSSFAVDNISGVLAASLVGATVVAPLLVQKSKNHSSIAFSLNFRGRENRFGLSIPISDPMRFPNTGEAIRPEFSSGHESVLVLGSDPYGDWNSRIHVSQGAMVNALRDLQSLFGQTPQTVMSLYPCQSIPFLVFGLAAIGSGLTIRDYQATDLECLQGVDVMMCDPTQLQQIAALPSDALNNTSLCVNLGRQDRSEVESATLTNTELTNRFSTIQFSDSADNLRNGTVISAERQAQMRNIQEIIWTVIGVKDAAVFPSVRHESDDIFAFVVFAAGVNRLQRFALIKKAIKDALDSHWLPAKMWPVDVIPKQSDGEVDIKLCQEKLRMGITASADQV